MVGPIGRMLAARKALWGLGVCAKVFLLAQRDFDLLPQRVGRVVRAANLCGECYTKRLNNPGVAHRRAGCTPREPTGSAGECRTSMPQAASISIPPHKNAHWWPSGKHRRTCTTALVKKRADCVAVLTGPLADATHLSHLRSIWLRLAGLDKT